MRGYRDHAPVNEKKPDLEISDQAFLSLDKPKLVKPPVSHASEVELFLKFGHEGVISAQSFVDGAPLTAASWVVNPDLTSITIRIRKY